MKEGLGIEWLWQLPDTHPFHWAGVLHDRDYDHRYERTSKPADQRFLKRCLKVAGNDISLKIQAYTFYGLARAWGKIYWKQKESKSLFKKG